jgi:dTDP-4-amino-4,6-dideoxygalactose transaminase/molybdenum cofactor biosynthesis enzyme MoaA
MFEKELRLIVTQKCNYDCTFCHNEGIEKDAESHLNGDDYAFLFLICQKTFGWNEVSITGGEPFLYNDINNMIGKIHSYGGQVTVVSNGEFVCEHKEIINDVKRINISVHTLNPSKYHNAIRRNDKFKNVLKNIAYIRNTFPKTELRLNAVLVKGLNDTYDDIIDLLNFTRKIGSSIKFLELETDKIENMVKLEIVENILLKLNFRYYDERSGISKKTLTDGATDVILSRTFCANAQSRVNPAFFCNKYNDLFITPDGYINVCRKGKNEISIVEEVKNKNKQALVEKINEAMSDIGKNCIYNKETRQLAINGGRKTFTYIDEGRFVHPVITRDIENVVIRQLHDTISIYDRSNVFKDFENDFASYHNKKYGLVISSGTAALWSMYDSIGLQHGDEIICPAYTFFATNTPIFLTGAKPVLADCNSYGNIDPIDIEKKVSDKTKAIVVTHMWGYPCEMDKIRMIADKHDLYLLEDASHAHGGQYRNIRLGSWGNVAVFSLQGNKIITGGEGGILITDDRDIYERALLLGHYNRRCSQEIDKNKNIYRYSVTGKGMKLRAHPLAIALAYEQFKNIDKINEQKQKYANMFINGLGALSDFNGLTGLSVLKPSEHSINAWHAMILKYDRSKMKDVSREKFVNAVKAEGAVEVDIPNSTCPVNRLDLFQSPGLVYPEYEEMLDYRTEDFINSNAFFKSIIKIPVWYTENSERVVEKYIWAFRKVCKYINEL